MNELHYRYGNFLTSGVHVLLLLIGVRIGTFAGWAVSLALISAINAVCVERQLPAVARRS